MLRSDREYGILSSVPPLTIDGLLFANLPARADRPAIVLGDDGLTYGELAEQVDRLAALLLAEGVRHGDRIAIHLGRSFEEMIATFAVARIGGVFVNADRRRSARQVAHVIQDSGARLLITDVPALPGLDAAGALDRLLRTVVVGEGPDDRRTVGWPGEAPHAPVDIAPPAAEDLASLIYTSGSTGLPKGVMHTHQSLLQMAGSIRSSTGITGADRMLMVPPLSFLLGLVQPLLSCLAGATLVLQPSTLPAEICATIRRERITWLCVVPLTLVELVRHLRESGETLPDVRLLRFVGSSTPRGTLESLPEVFPGARFYSCYGSTEAPAGAHLRPADFLDRMGSIGMAAPPSELFLIDQDGELCVPGESGELVHRGGTMFSGYWGDPQLTAERLRPCPALADRIGDEKVYFTGDLLRLDEDGFLWFEERRIQLIKSGGHRISPTEVELVVRELPQVVAAVAFGVPDERLDEVVHVSVECAGPEGCDPAALIRACRKELPRYMVPRVIHAWSGSMPRTTSGKIDRAAVRAHYQGNRSS